jgi:hypothetical protein
MGAGALVFGAWRYSKRTPPEGPAPQTGKDPDMEDRLEDELSRLDS